MDNSSTHSTPLPENLLHPTSTTAPSPKSGKKTFAIVAGIFLMSISVASVLILSSNQQPVTEPEAKIIKQETKKPLFVDIESPKGNVTAVAGEIVVKGKTLPNTSVIVYSDIDDSSVDSDAYGNFETSIVVGDTGGVVKVSAFSQTGEEASQTLNLQDDQTLSYVNTTAVLGKNTDEESNDLERHDVTSQSVGTGKETRSATLIEDKKNRPESTQIESTSEPEITVSPEKKGKQIKEFKNSTQKKKIIKEGVEKLKEILSSQSSESARLNKKAIKQLVLSEATPTAHLKQHALSGVITAIAAGQITISHQIQNDRVNTIVYNADTVVKMKGILNATPSDLTVGMRIAAVGETVDDVLLTKRIHVIPGKATGVMNQQPSASPSATVSVSAEPSATPSGTITPTITEIVTQAASPTAVLSVTPNPTTAE